MARNIPDAVATVDVINGGKTKESYSCWLSGGEMEDKTKKALEASAISKERFIELMGVRLSVFIPSNSAGKLGFNVSLSRPYHWVIGFRYNPAGAGFEAKPNGFYRQKRNKWCEFLERRVNHD